MVKHAQMGPCKPKGCGCWGRVTLLRIEINPSVLIGSDLKTEPPHMLSSPMDATALSICCDAMHPCD